MIKTNIGLGGAKMMDTNAKKVMVACCNFGTIWGDKEANLKKLKAW